MFSITFFLQHWVEILRFIRSIWETILIWILLFLLRKKKNPTPFIKGIFHFHATLFYLLNKWGQVLSSHHSPAGRSYPTFLQAVIHGQRRQYWATLLRFVKEKLLRAGAVLSMGVALGSSEGPLPLRSCGVLRACRVTSAMVMTQDGPAAPASLLFL